MKKYILTEQQVEFAKLRASFRGEYLEVLGLKPGEYIKLIHNGNLVMSNTPMEICTQKEMVDKANGDVLIAGLGLGLLLLYIQNNPDITSIMVIEKYGEVIELVAPQLPLDDKVDIVNADIFSWLPPEGTKYDTIYFDIWNNICGDNYPESKVLHKRFRKYFNYQNTNRYMDSWRRDDVRRLHRED